MRRRKKTAVQMCAHLQLEAAGAHCLHLTMSEACSRQISLVQHLLWQFVAQISGNWEMPARAWLTLWRFRPLVGWYRSSSSKSSILRFLARPLLVGFPCPGACTIKCNFHTGCEICFLSSKPLFRQLTRMLHLGRHVSIPGTQLYPATHLSPGHDRGSRPWIHVHPCCSIG